MMKKVLITFVLLSALLSLNAQEEKMKDDFVEQIEAIAERYESQVDMTDLAERLYDLLEKPVIINSGDPEEILRIPFINEIQAYNLAGYVVSYGDIFSLNELLAVDGFTKQNIKELKPFVSLESSSKTEKINFKNLFSRSKNRLFLRYQRVLEQQKGYLSEDGKKPVYAGDANKYYLRYNLQSKYLKIGVTAEKDAGEKLFSKNNSLGIDFLSLHAYYRGNKMIRTIALGDYHLRFGQGLTLWSGLSFGKSSNAFNVKKFGTGITRNSSANENAFLRGAATEISINRFRIYVFASQNNLDASVDTLDGEEINFNTIQESGFHRTKSELTNKDILKQQLLGGRFAYKGDNYTIGITGFSTKYDFDKLPPIEPYKYFEFRGNNLQNYGIDFHTVYRNFVFFGEGAYSSNGGLAAIGGLQSMLSQQLYFSLIYRNYGKEYANYFSNAFAEGSKSQNEEGLYLGTQILLHKRWTLNGYADFYHFPWLKFSVDAPSKGRDYLAQLNFSPSRKSDFYLRVKNEKKESNGTTNNDRIDPIISKTKTSIRFHSSLRISSKLTLKSRSEIVYTEKTGKKQREGFLLYQDVNYKFSEKVSTHFRYAIFDTYSYDERIYAYENDVLYAFSIPAYYYSGNRIYFLIKYQLSSNIDFWAKIASSIYSNKETTGSGNDETSVPHKTEVRFQIRVKF